MSITAFTTSVRPLCSASCRKDVSLLFSTRSAPRFSSSFTAATCPSLAAMCSAVFCCKLKHTTVQHWLFGFFLFIFLHQVLKNIPTIPRPRLFYPAAWGWLTEGSPWFACILHMQRDASKSSFCNRCESYTEEEQEQEDRCMPGPDHLGFWVCLLFIKTNNKVHISSKEEHVTEEAQRKLGSMTGQATIQHLYKYKWKTNSCLM